MFFGVDFRQFSDAAKLAFVDAAVADLKAKGAVASQSNVSALTGMSRKEVGRLFASIRAGKRAPDSRVPASEIINEWTSNSRYFGGTNLPYELPIVSSDSPSLSEIVNKHAPEYTVQEIVAELEESGCIEKTSDDLVTLQGRAFIFAGAGATSIYHFERTLYTLGSTLVSNILADSDTTTLFERSAFTYGLKPLALPRFLQLSRSAGENFLETMDEWLSANEDKSRKAEGDVVTGVGVFIFHQGEPCAVLPEDLNDVGTG